MSAASRPAGRSPSTRSRPPAAPRTGIIAGPDGACVADPAAGSGASDRRGDHRVPAPAAGGRKHPPDHGRPRTGRCWLTEPVGGGSAGSPPAGVITDFPVPRPPAVPFESPRGPDGDSGSPEPDANRIGRDHDRRAAFTEFPLPTRDSTPSGIAAAAGGALVHRTVRQQIGRITTAGSLSPNSRSRPPAADPNGIAAGPDGALWFTEGNADKIGRVTTAGSFSEFPIPTLQRSDRDRRRPGRGALVHGGERQQHRAASTRRCRPPARRTARPRIAAGSSLRTATWPPSPAERSPHPRASRRAARPTPTAVPPTRSRCDRSRSTGSSATAATQRSSVRRS